MKSFVAFLWKRHRARETSSPSPPFSITRYPQRRHSSFYYCRVIFRPCALAPLRLADQLTSGRLWNISRFKLAAREIDAIKVNEIVEGRRMYHRWWRCSRFEVFLPCNLFFASIPFALPCKWTKESLEDRLRSRYYLRIEGGYERWWEGIYRLSFLYFFDCEG